MYDPKRIYEDRTPPAPREAVRGETTRPRPPVPTLPSEAEIDKLRKKHQRIAQFEKMPKWKRNRLRRKDPLLEKLKKQRKANRG